MSMAPKLLGPTLAEVNQDGLDMAHACCARSQYGNFLIPTPVGRRMANVLKHRAWLPDRDGSYRTVEVPGPESYDVWYACWRVPACC
jgi:hypothetical protein